MFLLPYGLVHLALMDRFIDRFPCLWIAPIFQLPVTVEDVITAPLQFFSHRGYARARDTLDKIISLTHCPYLFGICNYDLFDSMTYRSGLSTDFAKRLTPELSGAPLARPAEARQGWNIL